jgi:hypothetical protein
VGVSVVRVSSQDIRAVRHVNPKSSAMRMAVILMVVFILAYSPFALPDRELFDD